MRQIILVMLLLTLYSASANAEIVRVVGSGIDREAAMHDAERQAVERVIGTALASKTNVENGNVTLDKISLQSLGFIKRVDIVSEQLLADGYCIEADIDVDTTSDIEAVSKLLAVLRLNNPPLAVCIMGDGSELPVVEQKLTEMLLEYGFSQLVGTDKAEVLVTGNAEMHTNVVSFPDLKGDYKTTNIVRADSTLTVSLMRVESSEIIGNFEVGATSFALTEENARVAVEEKLATVASDALAKELARIGSLVNVFNEYSYTAEEG